MLQRHFYMRAGTDNGVLVGDGKLRNRHDACRIGPIHWMVLTGEDGEGVSTGRDRLIQEFNTFGVFGPGNLSYWRDGEVVQVRCPLHRMVVASANGEGLPLGGDSPGQKFGTFHSSGPNALFAERNGLAVFPIGQILNRAHSRQ